MKEGPSQKKRKIESEDSQPSRVTRISTQKISREETREESNTPFDTIRILDDPSIAGPNEPVQQILVQNNPDTLFANNVSPMSTQPNQPSVDNVPFKE